MPLCRDRSRGDIPIFGISECLTHANTQAAGRYPHYFQAALFRFIFEGVYVLIGPLGQSLKFDPRVVKQTCCYLLAITHCRYSMLADKCSCQPKIAPEKKSSREYWGSVSTFFGWENSLSLPRAHYPRLPSRSATPASACRVLL
jgi:hypothetical protein